MFRNTEIKNENNDIETQSLIECLSSPIKKLCFEYYISDTKYDLDLNFIENIQATLIHQATEAAEHILWGKLDEAVALVTKNPLILHCIVEATDPIGRRVKGKLIQIAAMAGDVNLERTTKQDGIVESLTLAGGLSKEEVENQLAPIFSHDAMEKNFRRRMVILNALIKMTKAITKIKEPERTYPQFPVFSVAKTNEESEKLHLSFLAECKPHIDKFKKTLLSTQTEIITSGFIFDPLILCEANELMEEYRSRIDCDDAIPRWQFEYCIQGIGSLQNMLSARDGQILTTYSGVDYSYKIAVPERTQNWYKTMHESLAEDVMFAGKKLGIDFYLYCGRPSFGNAIENYKLLINLKKQAFKKILKEHDFEKMFKTNHVLIKKLISEPEDKQEHKINSNYSWQFWAKASVVTTFAAGCVYAVRKFSR